MLLATSNPAKRLLYLSYAGRVRPEELARGREDLRTLLAGLPPDFRLLVDLSALDAMGLDCLPELGRNMEEIDRHGVGLVVRVIPEPGKDIGLNILAIFHYPRHPRTVTCANLAEALRQLAL